MSGTPFSGLIERFPTVARVGTADPMVTGIVYDSREAAEDTVFVAVPGFHHDGHDFIDDARSRGCRAIVCERLPDAPDEDCSWAQVANSRQALSSLASRICGYPSRTIDVIGVTGTDGKTTTTYLIDQLLSAAEFESGFVSTALMKRDITVEKNSFRQSTPEAPEIQRFLREMIENGKEIAVLEATSHGLSDRTARLRDVNFAAAVFTNITHEHLEFHGTFEQYRSDKANLFRSLDRTASFARDSRFPIFAVVNADDPNSYYFEHATRQRVLTYSTLSDGADLYADGLVPRVDGTECEIHWRREARRVFIPLPGPFNVDNVLAAVLCVSQIAECNPLDLLDHVHALCLPPGRMEVVRRDLPFVPIVDYAHTPGSFERVLPMIKGYTPGRLIVVFGSAGERDVEKRSIQGAIAARHADIIVLTDEDPRGEDSMTILREIERGVRSVPGVWNAESLRLIADRRAAIRHAVALAAAGDTILFLGKGHEGSIIYDSGPAEWDEARVVGEEIARLIDGAAS